MISDEKSSEKMIVKCPEVFMATCIGYVLELAIQVPVNGLAGKNLRAYLDVSDVKKGVIKANIPFITVAYEQV